MAIANPALLVPGTVLLRTYKGSPKRCEVVADGYLYAGTTYPTLRAATVAAGEGKPAKPFEVWTIEGTEVARKEAVRSRGVATTGNRAARRAAKKTNTEIAAIIRATRNQDGVADGLTMFFCSACMDGWTAPTENGVPSACPNGHTRETIAVVETDTSDAVREAAAAAVDAALPAADENATLAHIIRGKNCVRCGMWKGACKREACLPKSVESPAESVVVELVEELVREPVESVETTPEELERVKAALKSQTKAGRKAAVKHLAETAAA